MQVQYVVTSCKGDSYYAKGDNDYSVVAGIFDKKDAVKARCKGIVKITKIISYNGENISNNAWEVVRSYAKA